MFVFVDSQLGCEEDIKSLEWRDLGLQGWGSCCSLCHCQSEM